MGKIFFSLVLVVSTALSALLVGCATEKPRKLSPAELAKQIKLESRLPFAVSIGGHKATLYSETCAKVAEPVAKNAEVVFDLPGDDVIVAAIYPCDKDGVAVPGGKPSAIVVYGGHKTSLAKTSDKRTLEKGFYLMDVTAGDANARILFEIAK